MRKVFVCLALLCAVQGAWSETPRIVAHRGGMGEYDDNALGAFKRSLAAGVTGYELDLRVTKDGEIVVMHDGKVDRTTTGTGPVAEMTCEAFRKLKLKRSGENPPTLAEVLALFQGRKDLWVEFEMKECRPLSAEAYCAKVDAAVSAAMPAGTYVYTSFSANLLAAMRAVRETAPRGLIVGRTLDDAAIETARSLGAVSVAPVFRRRASQTKDGRDIPASETTREMVDRAHAAGLRVALWPAPNLEKYRWARKLGADTCTSDYPVNLLKAVKAADAKAAARE